MQIGHLHLPLYFRCRQDSEEVFTCFFKAIIQAHRQFNIKSKKPRVFVHGSNGYKIVLKMNFLFFVTTLTGSSFQLETDAAGHKSANNLLRLTLKCTNNIDVNIYKPTQIIHKHKTDTNVHRHTHVHIQTYIHIDIHTHIVDL